jgi:iron complex transport system ATP-binding protein
MLDVQNISVEYGSREILREISFTLKSGEIIALLGANGAGKTTLIRALNGTIPLSTGEILLEGKELGEYSRREMSRKVAVVAQENETKFPVSVLQFVLAGRFAHGSAFGWETWCYIEIASAALEKCDLGDYANRMMNELSGGERQRVVLARAVAAEPAILLLDEPTANLDLAHQALMFRLVRERCRTPGASAIVITHDMNLASEFGDEVLLLNNGRIFAKGTPSEVLSQKNIEAVFSVKVLLDENPASRKVRVTAIY